jgi:hypothetical protein
LLPDPVAVGGVVVGRWRPDQSNYRLFDRRTAPVSTGIGIILRLKKQTIISEVDNNKIPSKTKSLIRKYDIDFIKVILKK